MAANKLKKLLKISLVLILMVVGIALFVINRTNSSSIMKKESYGLYMDTQFTFTLYGTNKKDLDDATLEINNIISKLDTLTSSYKIGDPKNIYHLNTSGSIPMNKDLLTLINDGVSYYNSTNHKLNIFIGKVTDYFESINEKKDTYDMSKIRPLINEANPSTLLLNEKISIDNKSVHINLGATAKGYAVMEASKILHKYKTITGALIDGSGNIMTYKSPPNKDYYKIAISDPVDQSKNIASVVLKGGEGISTSSDAFRFYTLGGKKYSHILEGDTGIPANNFKNITVISSSSYLSDILSTTLFTMTLDQGKTFLKTLKEKPRVIWVDKNNNIYKNYNFEMDILDENYKVK